MQNKQFYARTKFSSTNHADMHKLRWVSLISPETFGKKSLVLKLWGKNRNSKNSNIDIRQKIEKTWKDKQK